MLSIRSEREKLVVTSNQNFTRRSNGLSPECTTYYAIDEHSRISFAAILPDQSHRSAIRFFLMARAHFNRFGIIICRVYSDNGSCYRHWLYRKLMNELHLKQRFTRSYTSRTNGNAERFIQTALREWAYARSYQNSNGREEQIKYWLHDYNFHCPHASLKLQPLEPPQRMSPCSFWRHFRLWRHILYRLLVFPVRQHWTLSHSYTRILFRFLHFPGLHRSLFHFPMQKVEKIRLRMSSGVVWPVSESSAQRAR